MTLIKAEKISYTYPIVPDEETASGEQKTMPPEGSEDARKADGADAGAAAMVRPALQDVNLEIEEGQFVCILGRNGSGKSTFARHLNALIVPDEGTLWIDGMKSTDEERLWDIRASVGMIFQNPDNQIIGTVVDEDVAFGLENMGVPSEKIQSDVAAALESVGLEGRAKASPNKLSGGQKQRVAIAGILAMHPKCIVMDESTSMLDPQGRKDVMSAVTQLNREHGITIILITHYMDEALQADRVYVMDKGSVVMQGTPREIFSQPERIESMGLVLPQISQLAWRLRQAGVDIPAGIIEAQELKGAVLKLAERHMD